MSDQVTVAELIEILKKLPQEALVFVESDYGHHHCEGAHEKDGPEVFIEIG
jgi:hypothetical protein